MIAVIIRGAGIVKAEVGLHAHRGRGRVVTARASRRHGLSKQCRNAVVSKRGLVDEVTIRALDVASLDVRRKGQWRGRIAGKDGKTLAQIKRDGTALMALLVALLVCSEGRIVEASAVGTVNAGARYTWRTGKKKERKEPGLSYCSTEQMHTPPKSRKENKVVLLFAISSVEVVCKVLSHGVNKQQKKNSSFSSTLFLSQNETKR